MKYLGRPEFTAGFHICNCLVLLLFVLLQRNRGLIKISRWSQGRNTHNWARTGLSDRDSIMGVLLGDSSIWWWLLQVQCLIKFCEILKLFSETLKGVWICDGLFFKGFFMTFFCNESIHSAQIIIIFINYLRNLQMHETIQIFEIIWKITANDNDVSFTNLIKRSGFIQRVISIIKRRNSRGPNTEPWGTPCSIWHLLGQWLSTLT